MSLYIWDTNHVSLYERSHSRITERFRQTSPGEVFISIITAEEVMRGRLAGINSSKTEDERLARLYWFQKTLDLLKDFPIHAYSAEAKAGFDHLRRQKFRIGSQDLRIAAIALSVGATLVTCNVVDFSKVPGLTIQDWTV